MNSTTTHLLCARILLVRSAREPSTNNPSTINDDISKRSKGLPETSASLPPIPSESQLLTVRVLAKNSQTYGTQIHWEGFPGSAAAAGLATDGVARRRSGVDWITCEARA